MLRSIASVAAMLLLLSAGTAQAQASQAPQLYVYPAHGQTPEQEQQDEYQCYQFGMNETGFNPAAPQAPDTPPPQQKHGFLRGAFGGALLGVAVGAIAGNAGEGAEIGAASGGLFGGMRGQQQRNQQQQAAQQQAQTYQTNLNNYNRAYSACLEGRGYSVQ
jgi:hypothetical protein